MKKRTFLSGLLTLFLVSSLFWNGRDLIAATAQNGSDHVILIPFVGKTFQQQTTAFVRISNDSYNQIAALIQPLHTLLYQGFVWLELTARDLSILRTYGIDYELQQDVGLLLLNRFRFDPLEGEPPIPPEQRTVYNPGEEGFHLVQFFGPTMDEWLEQMLDVGVTLIQFQANHAYIVRMTPEEAALVDEQEFARWVGVYHAAYRIAPPLLDTSIPIPQSPAATQQIIENVDVTIFNDGQFDETVRAIIDLGGDLIDLFPMTHDSSLVTAIFALPSEVVVDVAQLNAVLWLNHRPPIDEYEDEMSSQIIAGNFNPLATGYQAWLASKGVDGTGVILGLVDSGYDTGVSATAHNDVQGRLIPIGAPADTNGHGTHVGGIMIGNAALGTTDAAGFLYGLGVAPNATMVVRTNTGADNDRMRDVVINGGVTSNHSYALQGASSGYTARDRTHDILVRDADQTTAGVAEPLIIVFSAGNSGLAGPTKEAKNIIAVGNSLNQRDGAGNPGVGNINAMAGGSSRGPAQDGRTYPHVAAPGTNIVSTRSTQIAIPAPGGTSCAATLPPGAPGANPTYSVCSGTSMAAPHVTGAVALITEWWRTFNAGANPSPAMAKALLINGAVDMDTADIPNNNEGWGRINLDNVILPPVPTLYFDQTTIFASTGDTWTITMGPADPTQPMKVTLVWLDAPGPGSGGTTAAWVNDLNLTLAQGGTTFRGNNFLNGWSTPGGAADPSNNAENVFIQNPSGAYDISVTAANIAGDGVPFNGDITDQDFALVCFNCTTPADLEITKGDFPDPVAAGALLTYTLQVTNNGPAQADTVVIVDTLPPGVSFISSLPGSPTCNHAAGVVTCDVGDLPNAGSTNVSITVQVDADLVFNNGGPLTITNQSSVSSQTPDSDPSNNVALEDTLVVAEADLEIVSFEAVDPPAEVLVGEDVTLVLRKVITNNGPSAPIDAQLTLIATPAMSSTITPTNVVQNQLALGLNEMREVFEEFTINCGAPSSHTFTITNEIQPLHAADTDPDLSNNTAQVEVVVECVLPVVINIKPGSFPNSIHPGSLGVIPVAILTTIAGEYGLPLAFDATSIDPLSVRFGPRDLVWSETGGAFEFHNRGHIEDSFELDEITKDGDLDIVLHFLTLATGISPGDIEACVKGEWMDSNGNVHKFFGCDSVRTVPESNP